MVSAEATANTGRASEVKDGAEGAEEAEGGRRWNEQIYLRVRGHDP